MEFRNVDYGTGFETLSAGVSETTPPVRFTLRKRPFAERTRTCFDRYHPCPPRISCSTRPTLNVSIHRPCKNPSAIPSAKSRMCNSRQFLGIRQWQCMAFIPQRSVAYLSLPNGQSRQFITSYIFCSNREHNQILVQERASLILALYDSNGVKSEKAYSTTIPGPPVKK